jgi:hypothetical protein
MRCAIRLTTCLLTLALAGCVTGYTLVPSGSVTVAQGMTVHPAGAWNKAPGGYGFLKEEEVWTQNGAQLDLLDFIAGLPDGMPLVKQKPKDERQVPVFHSSMSAQDLVSMVESAYRIAGGAKVFETTAVKPATFVGQQGVQFDYNYILDDKLKRRGRAVMAVSGGKLYLIRYNAAALHYFEAGLPQVESMTASAAVH